MDEQLLRERLENNNNVLKSLLPRVSNSADEELNKEELEELDCVIAKYEIQVEELKAKLANVDNYKRKKSDFEEDKLPLIEELFRDSISQERETLFKANRRYAKEKQQQVEFLEMYRAEVDKLTSEVHDIKARLNKDSIAKSQNIVKKLHLTDDEVIALTLELYAKRELIEQANAVMNLCIEEIKRYDDLIEENRYRLAKLVEKEQLLEKVLHAKRSVKQTDIDTYHMRLDQDELSKKQAGLLSLKRRREFLVFDPAKEITELIKQNEASLSAYTRGQTKVEETVVSEEVAETPVENNDAVEETSLEVSSTDETVNTNDALADDSNEEVTSEVEVDTQEEPENHEVVSDEITEENQDEKEELVEIYDAPESLKKQKLVDKFKGAWKNWCEKLIKTGTALAEVLLNTPILDKLRPSDSGEELDTEVVSSNNNSFEEPTIDKLPDDSSNNLFLNFVKENKRKLQKIKEDMLSDSAGSKPDEEIDGVEVETTILKAATDVVEINLTNGETICIGYGMKQSDVPEEITIKYEGDTMYIYSPVIKAKGLK